MYHDDLFLNLSTRPIIKKLENSKYCRNLSILFNNHTTFNWEPLAIGSGKVETAVKVQTFQISLMESMKLTELKFQ